MKILIALALLTVSASAAAWPCDYWEQHTDPTAECYKAPVPVGTNNTASSEAQASAQAAAIAAQQQRQAQHQAQQQAQHQAQGQGQTAEGGNAGAIANGTVNVEVPGDQNTYRSRALALSLPGLVAAPAVGGNCLEHSRGMGGLSIGVTGGTKLQEKCMDRQHCLSIADRFGAVGMFEAMAEQLTSCGGVKVTYVPPAPPVINPPIDYVPRAEFEVRLKEEAEKRQRMFIRGVGK